MSRDDFIREAYSLARQAGLPDHLARMAVAQSALETGFGRSVKKNNYFGIKATKSWKGPTQTFKTWEDVNGFRVNQKAKFRAYMNPINSFKDWAKVIGNKFPGVLGAKTFDQAAAALGAGLPGGYATDPNYASKLAAIDRYASNLPPALPSENAPIPTPRPNNSLAMMANARALDRPMTTAGMIDTRPFGFGGIMSPASISPVSSALAGELAPDRRMPTGRTLAPDRQMPSGPVKESKTVSAKDIAGMFNRFGGIENDVRAMPSGAVRSAALGRAQNIGANIPAKESAEYGKYARSRMAAPTQAPRAQNIGANIPARELSAYGQYAQSRMAAQPRSQTIGANIPAREVEAYGRYARSRMAAPANAPSAPASPSGLSPAAIAGYQQYGQTRMAAPVGPISRSPSMSVYDPVVAAQEQVSVAGPIGPQAPSVRQTVQSPTVQAQVAQQRTAPSPSMKEKKGLLGKIFSPENIAAAGLGTIGTAVAGPVGGLIGGLLGRSMSKSQLGSLLSDKGPYSGARNNLGSGIGAISAAMGGVRGDTGYSRSMPGMSVTNLGGGTTERRNERYGWTERTGPSGHTGISHDRGKGKSKGGFGGFFGGLFG